MTIRHDPFILARDPHTPPHVLARLARRPENPRACIAANPNCPTHLLLELALEYPTEVIHNPVFPLLFIEDPGLLLRLSPMLLDRLTQVDGCPILIWHRFQAMTAESAYILVDSWCRMTVTDMKANHTMRGISFLYSQALGLLDEINQLSSLFPWTTELALIVRPAALARFGLDHGAAYQAGIQQAADRISDFLRRLTDPIPTESVVVHAR